MDKLDFPTTETYTKEDIRRVQERLLFMGKTITTILEQNHYSYFLASGTLLGAVRHGGFVPWDDDFDLFMFDDQYDDAMECLKRTLPSEFVLQDKTTDPIYWPASAKVRDLKTKTNAVLFPDDNRYKYTGLNVDLYRLKKVQREFVDAHRKKEHIEFIVRKHDVKVLGDEEYLSKFIRWTREFTNYVDEYQKEIHDPEDCVYSHYGDFQRCEVKDIFPLKRYVFEDVSFLGPQNPDAVLKEIYGDYMKIPDYAKRKPHYDAVEFLD